MSEQLYQIEEFKIWKGLDPEKPLWSGRNLVGSKKTMEELAEYLKHNNPSLILRVEPLDLTGRSL